MLEDKTQNVIYSPHQEIQVQNAQNSKLAEIRKNNIILSSTEQKEQFSYPICWGILRMSGSAFST